MGDPDLHGGRAYNVCRCAVLCPEVFHMAYFFAEPPWKVYGCGLRVTTAHST